MGLGARATILGGAGHLRFCPLGRAGANISREKVDISGSPSCWEARLWPQATPAVFGRGGGLFILFESFFGRGGKSLSLSLLLPLILLPLYFYPLLWDYYSIYELGVIGINLLLAIFASLAGAFRSRQKA